MLALIRKLILGVFFVCFAQLSFCQTTERFQVSIGSNTISSIHKLGNGLYNTSFERGYYSVEGKYLFARKWKTPLFLQSRLEKLYVETFLTDLSFGGTKSLCISKDIEIRIDPSVGVSYYKSKGEIADYVWNFHPWCGVGAVYPTTKPLGYVISLDTYFILFDRLKMGGGLKYRAHDSDYEYYNVRLLSLEYGIGVVF